MALMLKFALPHAPYVSRYHTYVPMQVLACNAATGNATIPTNAASGNATIPTNASSGNATGCAYAAFVTEYFLDQQGEQLGTTTALRGQYPWLMFDLSVCYITCAAVVVTVYWPSNPRHEIIYTTGRHRVSYASNVAPITTFPFVMRWFLIQIA